MTYYLDPFGCVKNQVDAEAMMAVLNRAGWVPAADSSAADLIIVNSCGFIESAKRESINAVLSHRRAYPEKKILLAGCLAQRYAGELSGTLTEADLFFDSRDLSKTAEAAAAAMAGDHGIRVSSPPPAELFPFTGERPLLSLPGSAYVKIAEGCDNRCSFCAIPLIRGPLRSRPIPQVVEECRGLLDRGVRELCVIGQDTGSYGKDRGAAEGALFPLLEALSRLRGSFWVRLLYIHPDHFPRPILEICRQDRRFLPYFDIPFQHGAPGILRAMNRRGDGEGYLALIDEIRGALPAAVIRSTFLTGFPGETHGDFEALLDFQDRARLDWLGVFTYSREEGTPAYAMRNRVPKRVAAERKRIIEERQTAITEKQMNRFVGQTLEVLVEEPVAEPAEDVAGGGGLYLGRLYCQAPEVDGSAVIHSDGPLRPGTLVRGRVFARAGFDLEVRSLL
ncbi:MAG: 30S ribosomal protein S12 methylthiotransferase RimO [Spirochaetaceae bacterium]|jgi:ribosomal protein S12 methylthiotransferase|nr:30S ribosomal protein S12 methylthiotransferase RimO [Spirochaetaceae bacterium]